jgi:hypothetical protein
MVILSNIINRNRGGVEEDNQVMKRIMTMVENQETIIIENTIKKLKSLA